MFRGKIRVVAGFSAAAALTFAGVLPALAAEGEEPGTDSTATNEVTAPAAEEAAPTEAAPAEEPPAAPEGTAATEEAAAAETTVVTPAAPKFNQLGMATYLTGLSKECVDYSVTPEPEATGAIRLKPAQVAQTITVTATPQEGCSFTEGARTVWTHTVPAYDGTYYDHGGVSEGGGLGFTEGKDDGDILEAYRVNCEIFLGVYYATAGTYWVSMWDEGEVVTDAVMVDAAADQVVVTKFPVWHHPGLHPLGWSLEVEDNEGTNQDVLYWNFDDSPEVTEQCMNLVKPAVHKSKTVVTKKLADTGASTSHYPLAALALVTVGGALAARRLRTAQL